MNVRKYLLATIAAAAAAGLASAGPASACQSGSQNHHPVTVADELALDIDSMPADLPHTLDEHGLQTIHVNLEKVEATGELENDVSGAS